MWYDPGISRLHLPATMMDIWHSTVYFYMDTSFQHTNGLRGNLVIVRSAILSPFMTLGPFPKPPQKWDGRAKFTVG